MSRQKTRSLSIQQVQERFPWIMTPLSVFNVITTPERWTAGTGTIASRISRALVIDSTQPAAFFVRNTGFYSRLRASVLKKSGVLMHLDWRTRQLFWASLWAGAVVSRLWPMGVPVPAPEKKIRLISAPESYPDFDAPTLVVPANVPRAEMSLGLEMLVQVMHFFQDTYPVIAAPQPEADKDPRTRVKNAFSWIHRLVRTPPHWHDDLYAAAEKKNLLGALAIDGPYAKLLRRAAPDEDRYLIDLSHMSEYPVRDGLMKLGCRIHYAPHGRSLGVTSIEYNGEHVSPSDAQWDFVEQVALCSLVTHLTVWRHGMQYHVAGLAPVAPLVYDLPPEHPIRRLLAPHVAGTISTNFHTHLTLRRSGFDVTGFSFSYETILRYYDDAAKRFDLSELDIRVSDERRGIPETIDYFYSKQARRYYAIFESYVTAYVSRYYPTDDDVQADGDLQAFFEALDTHIVNGIRGYVPSLTRVNLIKLLTLFIYSVTVEHEENTQWDYSVFLPPVVHADGTGPTVGEVQSVMDFQLVISSATNRLLADTTHLALDPEAAAIMRQFQADLKALEAEMETEPERHGQVFPSDLEASVSA